MTDKYVFYELDGERYKVPSSQQSEFERMAPSGTKVMLTYDGENYGVPLSEFNSFVGKAGRGNVTYSAFDDNKQYQPNLSTENLYFQDTKQLDTTAEPQKNAASLSAKENASKSDDDVTWWETFTKGTGGMLAGVGSSILNATIQATSGTMMNPRTGEYFKGVDYEDRIDDMSDPLVRTQKKAEETSVRLAKEADPTGGNVGYVDLIKEGKFGTAMQKGLADMIQSAPMTLAAYNPYTMAINAILMASDNYAKETRDNPEVDDWKRMAYSVGGAAIEQAVEKFADPIFKYLGGGKEMTEDIAKELLENITKESADGIKKRILKTIGRVGKNTLKDAGGEGVEEIVTSFGNDALGMALDAIDGDKDYGISAQWEEFKKQNPNATKEDFAEAKAKEYADAFIGGALSSVYMSGTAQAANEIATPIRENKAREDIQKAHDYGAMLNYDSIYDTDSDVVEASTAVSDSFKDKDGNPAIGEEFISTLTSEDALMLASRAEVSSEQRTALYKLAQKKAVQEGLNESLDGRLESELNAQRITIERATENGKIVTGQHNGKDVFIKGATINKKGKISLPKGPVLVIDMRTGEQYAATDNLVAMGNMDAAEYEQKITELFARQDALKRDFARKTMSPKAKLKAVQPFARKKILVDVGNGITEVFVESISPKGEVMIKGKKGDLGGQSILTLDAVTFYDSIYRDNDGNPVVTEVEQQTEGTIENEPTEEPTEEPVAPTELTGEEDFRDYEGPILVGGRLVDVTEAQQDNPSNTVNYTYVDENGNMRVGSMTIGEFAAAIQQAQAQNIEPAPVVSPEPQPEPQPAPKDDVVATPIPTESIDWDALLDNDAEAYFNELQNRFGDKAERRLNAMITATENRLNKLNKENPQDPEEVFANDELKEKLENRLEVLKGLAARFTTTAEPAPTEPAPAEPSDSVLDNGYIVMDGKIVNPDVIEMPDNKNKIYFAEKDGKWGYGYHAVTDDNNESWNDTIQLEMLRYDSKEDAIKGALSYFNTYKDIKKNSPSTGIDTFIQYINDTYFPNTGDSQGNSVPLENEENGDNNEARTEVETDGGENRPSDTTTGNESDGSGNHSVGKEEAEGGAIRNDNSGEGDSLEDKYPPRTGDATRETIRDTFGLKSVGPTLSDPKALNTIYDVLMEMCKLLGISPKSVGHAGMLTVSGFGNKQHVSIDTKAWYEKGENWDGTIADPRIRVKDAYISSILHEWWHSLDHALNYSNTGKGNFTTSVGKNTFTGRKEVHKAINDVIKAIKASGHVDRMDRRFWAPSDNTYFKSKKEITARAFKQYILDRLEAAGIIIDGLDKDSYVAQPTAEEMKVIAPAFDNLFKVLHEKDGKTPETSILYHIEKQMTPGSEAWRQATDTVLNALSKAGIEVVRVTEQQVADVVNNANENGAEILKTTDGVVYGWTDGQKIYLTEAGVNPNTPIHEYTHLWADAMMRKNPNGWNSIKKLLKGTPVWNEVVSDPNYSDIANNEDAVASEVLSRISGTENAQKLDQMAQEMIDNAKGTMRKAEARGIIQNIKDALNKFWNWVGKELFGIENFNSINEVTDRVLWDLMNQTDLGIPNAGEATQITNANGDVIADTNGKGRVRFSISTWRDGGRDYLYNWLKNDKTLTKQEKADILARMDEFYENAQKYTDVYVPFGSWSEAAIKYDKDGNPLMSVIKKNGDYSMNLDFSLVCKKRRPLNKLLRTLINRNAFGTYSLRERELAEINWILQEHGFEVACALCFVDSKRYRVTGVADVFAELYNKFVKALAPEGANIAHFNYSNNPNVESVENGLDTLSDEQLNWDKFNELASQYEPTTVEGKVAKFLRENPSQRRLVDATDFIDASGFEAVKEGNPALLSLYNSKKGTGGPKASFGDVQYLNDILKKSRAFTASRAYDVGGVRLQSFSDFVPHMYFDYMQLFAELSAKKLPAHAYTKEVLFAKIFGLTGLKINMSLVPAVVEGGIAPGLDANGNYAWADAVKDKDGNVIQQAQSFPFDEAMAIQNAEGYSKNCGVIAVGISDEHIEKMLNDPNIPFIIPYHKSSLNAIVARMTNIDQYKDYTNVQNTKKADGTKLDEGAKDFNFNAWLRKNKGATPKDAAQAYLDWCKKNNYRPKFSQFAYHPNYYKLLVDFNTVDARTGEYTPQGAVTMTFPTKDNSFGDVETLIQQGLQEDAELEEKMDSEIEEVANEVEERLAEIKNEPEMSEKEYAEKMAELADERMARIRERAEVEGDGILSRSGDVTTEDIRNEKAAIKKKAIADGTFMKAPNGEPTNLTEDQWLTVRTESFKNWFGDWENDPKNASKVVDKNGEPQVVYHGSPYGAITEFDRRGHSVSGLREFGSYFSTSKELAQLYAYARQQAKGDIEKYELEKYRLDAIIFNNETPARIVLDAFNELDRLEESQKPKVYEVFLNIREPKVFDAERSNGWDGWHKLKQDVGYDIKSGVEAIEAIAGHNRAARMKDKYDGIIAQNMADVHSEATEDLMGDVFLVFDETPANIKSATSNIGTFDPNNADIRYRRSAPTEFYQVEVDEFLSKYNPNCEVNVYPINEDTAKAFGYTLKELRKKLARYMPDYDFIAIFAREDITEGNNIEMALFHESIHKLSNSSIYPYLVKAGKWMWEHSTDNELFSSYRKYIEKYYSKQSEERKHDEMLAYVLSNAMEHGMVDVLNKITPKEVASIFNEILNEIGYDSGAETSKRRDEQSVSQSEISEDAKGTAREDGRSGEGFGQTGATGRSKDSSVESRSDIQNAAVDYNVGETRDGIIERAVSEEAQKLGVNVIFAKRSEMAKGHETDKGYYNTKTGEIVICPENNASIADAIQTILHEAVAHKGLRQLMGDKFDEFINRVYDALDAKTKAEVDKLADEHYKGNKAVAMEEYMASLAEREDFNDNTIWDKIKDFFTDLINKILDRDDIVIGDNELRYILRASYNNMVNPRGMETIRGWAKDQTMREEYKINKATPELLSRTGIDPTQVSSETAKAVYDRVVSSQWQEFERQFQDAMQPVRIAIDAIQQETGNIPIEDYENYILIQNHASSRSRVEIDEFERRYFGPIVDKVNEVVTAYIKATGGSVDNEAQRAAVYKMIKNYLIAKHGLERNQYYQLTKKRKLTPYEKKKEIDKLTEEYETKVNDIRNDSTLNDTEKELEIHKEAEALRASIIEVNERLVPDLRDYSGLTTLFGFPPRQYKKAEEEAKKYVADIEKKLGRVDDEDGNVVTESPILTEMWDKIKSATDKTLRHSYECGLLSRGQYEEIKDMFTHYIPLRGYDETTAEDVYSYSRFEGNRFNPAVQTVKGRTSLAEDPLAIIMNMAESEIAQGNKNRAKQALYNYLLNRSAGNKDQNSLMQIESVWYLVNYDEAGNEYFTIAAPNHEAGETYEEFEARMIALEEEEKAFKSKKGKVNVGMRFQKQMDRNSHYVYLKVNGVEKAIYINGDPKAADAINGTYYPKSNAVVDKIKDVNRFISSTFTNYSLSFTARNFVRDAIYSRINISIRESDPAYRKQFRKNYWHAFGNMRKLIKAYRNGELDGRDLNPEEAAFVEFMRNGGQTGYTVINSVENHKKELERAIKRMQRGTYNGGGKSGFIAMFKWIELMNESSELLTRFVAYKTSRDMGRGVETSIGNAKEITVNFNTRGAQDGTGILGGVARYFGWSKYFFNASVQGVQNLTAMAKANKIKFCETVGGIIGFGFAMPFIHALASLWGDDDENEYWNIPEYDRQNNICIQAFGTYIKIPLPIGFREMYAIGDTMAAALCDKKFTRDLGQIGKDMANKVASIVLPINPLESAANGLDLWQTGLYAILPSGTQFAIQNTTNIDWKGAPLQKEYTYNEHDPQWTKAFASNPKWMTGLSKWCNENINLDGDFDGMDWSPEKLDNTLSNVFGGMYSLVKQTGKSIYTMFSKDKDFNVMSVPLVGVVLSSGIDEDDRFITDAYYDMKEYYDENVNSIKRTAKAFGYDLKEVFSGENVGAHHPRMQRIYNNRNFDFMQEWYAGNKELESLKNKIEYREKKIAGMDEVPNELMEEIAALKNELENERREFVNDMLELD